MGTAAKPSRVKLFCGLIYKDDRQAQRALTLLKGHFGETDLESPVFDFSLTDYYQKEFGEGLKKRFVAFKRLIFPHDLPKIKTLTNNLEKKLSSQGRRLVNLDPGYLDLAKVVLASTKDYIHRIYLARGIYAEMTLFYRNRTFNAWEWTYPDYRKQAYIDFFNELRKHFVQEPLMMRKGNGRHKKLL